MSKILFISHDASRTGAPILLINLADVLSKSDLYKVSFLINRPNYTIINRFRLFECYEATKRRGRFQRLLKRVSSRIWNTKISKSDYATDNIKSAINNADMIICNTLTNGDLLPTIRRFYNGPIITYVHELSMATKAFTNSEALKIVLDSTTCFLVPCLTVRDFLVNELKVKREKVNVLEYYIPSLPVQRKPELPNTGFVVGGVGTIDWRKGVDLFIQVAYKVLKKYPNSSIVFHWIGAHEGVDLERLNHDISKSGLDGKIVISKSSDRVYEYYTSIDLLLLTSREDPYPLVVLEAANAFVPTICFSDAGGASEFVTLSGGGRCVRYLDVDEMVDAVLFYYDNQEKIKEDGTKGHNRLVEIHQNEDRIVSQFGTALNVCSKKNVAD